MARDKIFLKMLVKKGAEVTPEEVEYFRKHPDQIDEITAPVNVHKLFLLAGSIIGISFVGFSKIIEFSEVLQFRHGLFEEFVVEIIFEIGVALIGGGVTAFLLGILLNQQMKNAEYWRTEIRNKIREIDDQEELPASED